jgi:hypothetical protein
MQRRKPITAKGLLVLNFSFGAFAEQSCLLSLGRGPQRLMLSLTMIAKMAEQQMRWRWQFI